MAHRKYTVDRIQQAVLANVSVAGVCRTLGIGTSSSSMQTYISRRIKSLGLDTAHFLGQGANRGRNHKGGPAKLSWQQVLVYDRCSGRKEHTSRLRKAMIESGIPHCCGECSCNPVWRGEALVLQIEHKNRCRLDNRQENLLFLCPNCHRQTPTYGSIRLGGEIGRTRQIEGLVD